MIKKCVGCGIILQDNDINKAGYVKDISKQTYCMRCFKLKNYGEKSTIKPAYNNDSIITMVNRNAKQTVFLVDLLNINSETMNTFKKINTDKVLVISKMDIIPKGVNLNLVINNIKDIYKIDSDVLIISSLKKKNISGLRNYISKNITYIVGYTNSGKSTLINTLMGNEQILTSNMINTTLDFNRIENEELVIYDTPGLLYDVNYSTDLNVLNKLSATIELKPLVYQLKPQSGIVMDKLILFNDSDVISNITLYVNNIFEVKKVFKKDVNLNNEYNLKNEDLVIKGLGFISTKIAPKLLVSFDNINLIEKRNTIFGGSHE